MTVLNTPQWFPQTSLYLIFLGLSSHLYFARGEWDMWIWKHLFAFALLQPLAFGALVTIGWGLLNSAALVLILDLSYVVPLFGSIAIYRLFFHPIRKTPGPFWARLSMLWKMRRLMKEEQFEFIDEMHRRYGDVVRLGPRLISINRASAISVVYGTGSKCRKTAFYDQGGHGGNSLHTCRNHREHAARRPAWDKALSARTNMEYEPRLMRLTNLLVSKLADHGGEGVNITEWFQCFVFDMMGEIGFSKSYRSLETGKLHPAIEKIHKYLAINVLVGHIPWFTDLLLRFHLPNPMSDFEEFAAQSLEQRRKETVYSPDVMSYVFDGKVKLSKGELIEDTILLQIAGSDTTLSALVFVLYHLARDKQIQQELRDEINNAVPHGQSLLFSHIAKLPLLEGVINETLRLHPPVPSGLPRNTPSEGIYVDDIYIPGDISVSIPTWTIHHDPRNFPSPNLFLPHRWTESSTIPPHDKRAFIPFSLGPYNCVGQIFAMMEMKTVIARLVETFEIDFAPGEDGTTLLTETHDHLTVDPAALMLSLTRREFR